MAVDLLLEGEEKGKKIDRKMYIDCVCVSCSSVVTLLGTCCSSSPFSETCVDAVEGTAVGAWGSCHCILQELPSPKNNEGHLGPGSVFGG